MNSDNFESSNNKPNSSSESSKKLTTSNTSSNTNSVSTHSNQLASNQTKPSLIEQSSTSPSNQTVYYTASNLSTKPTTKKRNLKPLWILLGVVGVLILILVISYIVFTISLMGNGQKLEIEDGRLYFVPLQDCNAETERMTCSVTGNPYSWCHCEEKYYPDGTERLPMPAKPIIYLYPTTETEVGIKLGYPDNLTTVYPTYQDGWRVKASPSGDLIDLNSANHNQLYALYWEGISDTYDREIHDGFVIKGEDTAQFLEEKLTLLGLNFREREEFIVYWLPKLEQNPYNYIHFATAAEIEAEMPLEITPQPNTTIRVRMLFKALDEYQDIPEQSLTPAPERSSFTVVEWGGVDLGH